MVSEHQLLRASLRPASADASFRRYLRIDAQADAQASATGPIASRIIMDAPPHLEDSASFVHVAGVMAAAGLSAPQVLDWDRTHGFLLLSDLGSQTMMDVIDPQDANANHALYLQALDCLLAWQLASKPGVLPVYDEALLRRELALFPDWYLQQYRGVSIDSAMRSTLDKVFSILVEHNLRAPSVYVHCDFMPRNLMIPPTTSAHSHLGILDFQDATYGPITYDIASLMRDAFLSWEEDFVLDITVRYWEKARKAGLPVGDDFGEFYRAVEWMGLQRHLRIAGVFARLTLRDGKPKYLADAPRFIGYIRATAARYRELKPLLQLVDQVEGIQTSSGFAFGRV
jgi:aminoglycoside/choline kinase family phosphotransferase